MVKKLNKYVLLIGLFLFSSFAYSSTVYICLSDGTCVSMDQNAIDSIVFVEPHNLDFRNTNVEILEGFPFSVDLYEQVCFSPGNLQYSNATDTWKFADNQWESLEVSNLMLSSDYQEFVDL
ncbi:MAG: hypothetical protein J5808_04180, partial [Paludibacteraceae bacterium]|nr:hypothetical protein [Paludibacteraceae bacterium]